MLDVILLLVMAEWRMKNVRHTSFSRKARTCQRAPFEALQLPRMDGEYVLSKIMMISYTVMQEQTFS